MMIFSGKQLNAGKSERRQEPNLVASLKRWDKLSESSNFTALEALLHLFVFLTDILTVTRRIHKYVDKTYG
jgi:hypothetical protein